MCGAAQCAAIAVLHTHACGRIGRHTQRAGVLGELRPSTQCSEAVRQAGCACMGGLCAALHVLPIKYKSYVRQNKQGRSVGNWD